MTRKDMGSDEVQKPDEILVTLTTILLLEEEARRKEDISQLRFFMVNETHRLFPYRQCVFWETDAVGKVRVRSVSGLSVIDSDSPYLVWLEGVISKEIKEEFFSQNEKSINFKTYKSQDFDEEAQTFFKEWGVQNTILLSMNTTHKNHKCGLWIDRETPFKDRDERLLSQISDSYAHSLDRLLRKHDGWRDQLLSFISLGRVHKIIMAIFLVIFLLPVRLSVVVPAKIVPHDPFVISSPVQGVIFDVNVVPNDIVKKGDVLIEMEDTVLRNKSVLAFKSLEIAQTSLQKSAREAFSDSKRKSELSMLQAEVEAKKLEYDYALDVLSLLEIKSPKDGVVIFAEPNALRGMPVQPGERIMSLVNPEETELLIRVPVDSVIRIRKDIPVKLFLNFAPLSGMKAEIKTISYEATPDPDGLLTYKIQAVFLDDSDKPSIGLRGTARVYGDYTIFGYQVFRRPLASLRRITGL